MKTTNARIDFVNYKRAHSWKWESRSYRLKSYFYKHVKCSSNFTKKPRFFRFICKIQLHKHYATYIIKKNLLYWKKIVLAKQVHTNFQSLKIFKSNLLYFNIVQYRNEASIKKIHYKFSRLRQQKILTKNVNSANTYLHEIIFVFSRAHILEFFSCTIFEIRACFA